MNLIMIAFLFKEQPDFQKIAWDQDIHIIKNVICLCYILYLLNLLQAFKINFKPSLEKTVSLILLLNNISKSHISQSF